MDATLLAAGTVAILLGLLLMIFALAFGALAWCLGKIIQ